MVARVLEMTRRCPATWTGQRRAFFLRTLATRALAGRPVDSEALGARMRFLPYNNVCEKRILFTPQFFDPRERAALAKIITPDFRFIDVGANIGGYALHVAALAGPGAQILAIEPQPAIFERLAYNIRQNRFATLKALDCAVSDREGEVTLFVDTRNNGATSMRYMRADSRGPRLRVMAHPLLALASAEGFTHIDAIKCDAEGGSDLVLEPFLRDAPKALLPRMIIVEAEPVRASPGLAEGLEARSYSALLETRANIVFERRADR
jgi:FkbM family methyltransferase